MGTVQHWRQHCPIADKHNISLRLASTSRPCFEVPSWFLPLGFTFTADGPLRLDTVIPHPTRPTLVLATPGDGTSPPVPLLREKILAEANRTHSREETHSTGREILARFVDPASGSAKVDVSRRRALHYSAVDHEVRTFAAPLSDAVITAIVALPKVRKHINSGYLASGPCTSSRACASLFRPPP